jgi:hypothetical protein
MRKRLGGRQDSEICESVGELNLVPSIGNFYLFLFPIWISMQQHLLNRQYGRFSKQDGLENFGFLSSREEPLVDRGDDFVLASPHSNGNFLFESVGKVISSDEIEVASDRVLRDWPNKKVANRKLPDGQKLHVHSFSVQTNKSLTTRNSLNDLAFSLVSIDHYSNPIRHFSRSVQDLPFEDFETISKGLIYLARTAFGKIANALPYENRLELRLIILDRFPSDIDAKNNYPVLLEILSEYLERRILSRGRQLLEINQKAQKIFGDDSFVKKIAFGNEDNGEVDFVYEQAKKFEWLFKNGKPDVLPRIIEEVKRGSDNESRFVRLFRRRAIPLNLG